MRAGKLVAGIAWTIMLLGVGCGSGDDGGGTGGTGVTRNGASVGVIAAKSGGEVTVNGVRFRSAEAQVTVDGASASADDLAVGMVAKVRGSIREDDGTGSARNIDYAANVLGPLEAVTGERLTVLGQPVSLSATTACYAESGAMACSGFAVNDTLEVSGFADAAGVIRASFIKRRAPGVTVYRVGGRVSNLDGGARTFALNALQVQYAGASGDTENLADNREVVVVGPSALGVLAATRVTVDSGAFAGEQEGNEAEIEGYVTAVHATGHFELNGETVRGDERTRYRGVTAQEIAIGMRLEVAGTLAAGAIAAHDIELRARN